MYLKLWLKLDYKFRKNVWAEKRLSCLRKIHFLVQFVDFQPTNITKKQTSSQIFFKDTFFNIPKTSAWLHAKHVMGVWGAR